MVFQNGENDFFGRGYDIYKVFIFYLIKKEIELEKIISVELIILVNFFINCLEIFIVIIGGLYFD